MSGDQARRVHHLRPLKLVKADPPVSNDEPVALLSVDITHEGRRCAITPAGDLDMSTVGSLEAVLLVAEAGAARQITIDLSQLTFMDSSGLHMLLKAAARAQENGIRLRFIRGPRRVQTVFELTNTERILTFVD